jgi:hypothetical protein
MAYELEGRQKILGGMEFLFDVMGRLSYMLIPAQVIAKG